MIVVINGESRQLDQGASVGDALTAIGVDPDTRGVAVAVDGQVVPRAELASTELRDQQRVEVVAAIQGGAR